MYRSRLWEPKPGDVCIPCSPLRHRFMFVVSVKIITDEVITENPGLSLYDGGYDLCIIVNDRMKSGACSIVPSFHLTTDCDFLTMRDYVWIRNRI